MRSFVSLGTLFSFILLIVSSVILYITPEGRIAYWANWSIGLTKSQWGDIHITGGLLFIILACWHTAYNFRAITAYCKRSLSGVSKKPWPLLAALGVCALVYAGTIYEVQPMRQLAIWNAQIKQNHSRKYGNPPFGHAENSSLRQFCSFLDLDLPTVLAALQKEGFSPAPQADSIFRNVAGSKDMTPQQLYELILESSGREPPASGRKGKGREAKNL